MTAAPNQLAAQFGDIDVYLFDQLLRGRITPRMTVLDAGCGKGRNLVYLLRSGYRVLGVDEDAERVATVVDAALQAPGGRGDDVLLPPLEHLEEQPSGELLHAKGETVVAVVPTV